ncbi:MAG: hypothetical protein K2X80_16845 [Pseudomonadaceae bacterium]|nr:hypothetical protein [Pseudomonadaceae bacterium]
MPATAASVPCALKMLRRVPQSGASVVKHAVIAVQCVVDLADLSIVAA